MPETMKVECGFCRKRFRCPLELRNRPVRCPYCKTITKVPASTEAARQAVGAISDMVAVEKADREKVPLAARHRVAPPTRGVRSKELLIVWLGALGLGLIAGGIGIYWLYASGPSAETNSVTAAKADDPKPAATKSEKRFASARRAAAVAQASARAPASGAKEEDLAEAVAPGSPPGADNRNPAATKSGKESAAEGDAAAVGQASAPAPASESPEEDVTVKVEGLLGGFKDETVTYAVGRVTNNTNGTLKVVKVIVRIGDKNDKELGEATQVLLNLPAGATAPLVAEWQHAEGVRGRKWMAGCQLNPMDVPQGLPRVSARDVIAVRDPNASATTGKIKVLVVNGGVLPLPQVQFYAILTAPDGKIVGAVKATVDSTLPPNKPQEVTFPWVNCRGSLVQGTEVWAQAGL